MKLYVASTVAMRDAVISNKPMLTLAEDEASAHEKFTQLVLRDKPIAHGWSGHIVNFQEVPGTTVRFWWKSIAN